MAEIIVCSFGFIISVFMLAYAQTFPKSFKPGVPSSGFFPSIVNTVLMLLSLFCLIHSITTMIKAKKSGTYTKKTVEKAKVMQILEIVILMFLYAGLWQVHIGHFLINSIVIFSAICVLFGDDAKWQKSVMFATGLVVFIYLLFTYLLKVRLW